MLNGLTDTSGNLLCVCAANNGETGEQLSKDGGNDGEPTLDDNGYTDTNGNLECKAYA